ncbi:MAG TPA: ornithine aminomutase [Kosmotogaceae bacterium]|nr:MAG: Uncharacterized protein XE05_0064 [Thermotogales bacterium 46_20]HAA84795.1 ornithine aminomutase [Kosmotogaceae bacterium]
MAKPRNDDLEKRSAKLKKMTDEELDRYFWELADLITEPLIELARTHTSPSIERSVLLRMGFNSLQAKELVSKISEHGLLGKGAGHVVLKLSDHIRRSVLEAGQELIEGKHWEIAEQLFKGGKHNGS